MTLASWPSATSTGRRSSAWCARARWTWRCAAEHRLGRRADARHRRSRRAQPDHRAGAPGRRGARCRSEQPVRAIRRPPDRHACAYPAQVLFCRERINSLAELRASGSAPAAAPSTTSSPRSAARPSASASPKSTARSNAARGLRHHRHRSGNSAQWYEVTKGMYTLTVGWSSSLLRQPRPGGTGWTRGARRAHPASMKEVEDQQWKLADEPDRGRHRLQRRRASQCPSGPVVERTR